jgi:hypothetical protein
LAEIGMSDETMKSKLLFDIRSLCHTFRQPQTRYPNARCGKIAEDEKWQTIGCGFGQRFWSSGFYAQPTSALHREFRKTATRTTT